jgi:hypothetical protein
MSAETLTLMQSTAIYGIRVYTRGCVLRDHVDVPETHHISAIINIDQVPQSLTTKRLRSDAPHATSCLRYASIMLNTLPLGLGGTPDGVDKCTLET